jgi:hypothetical protein
MRPSEGDGVAVGSSAGPSEGDAVSMGSSAGPSGDTPCEHAVSSTKAHAAEIDQAAQNARRIHITLSRSAPATRSCTSDTRLRRETNCRRSWLKRLPAARSSTCHCGPPTRNSSLESPRRRRLGQSWTALFGASGVETETPRSAEVDRRIREHLDALGPAPRAERLHVLMLPDFDRAERDRHLLGAPGDADLRRVADRPGGGQGGAGGRVRATEGDGQAGPLVA